MPSDLKKVRGAGIGVLVMTGVLLSLTGFWRMFGHFPGYDDEGYILYTVRAYLEHGNLYNGVYTQYGPGFYVLLEGVQSVLGVTIDHAFARWFTLVLWLGTAWVMGVVTKRATGSRAGAWFVWVTTFLYLHQFSEEAFHPGVVCCFVLAGSLWTMLELIRRGLASWAMFVAGSGTAILGLLKVNVGVIFAAGCALWLVFVSGKRWLGRGPGWWGVLAGVLFAAALMHGLLGTAWVGIFLGLLTAGLAGLGATIPLGRRAFGAGTMVVFAAGAVAVIAIVAGVVMYHGTSMQALLEGVIFGPLRHADAYSYAVDWRPGSLVLALVAMLALAGHRQLVNRGRSDAAARLLVGLRLAHIFGILIIVALLGHFRVIGVLFSYSIPWLWLWLMPLPDVARDEAGQDARGLVACVLIMQTLHAYPVGGIQICWGSFPLFALIGMAVPETGAWLEQRAGVRRGPGVWLCGLLLLVTGGKGVLTAVEYRQHYLLGEDLQLPGTAGMRLSRRESATYQIMVTNSVAHADMLFSLPGMFSFNLWSDLPTPTLRNTTLWYALLSEPEQIAIIRALEKARRPMLVVDRTLISILQTSGAPPKGPLYAHLLANFRPAFSLHGLDLWVKAGRTIAPIGTLRSAGDHALQVCLIGSGGPVEAVEISDPDDPSGERVVLDASNTRIVVQPLNSAGNPQGPSHDAGWPLQFDGLAWITLSSGELRARSPEHERMLVLKYSDGRLSQAALSVDP